MRTQFGFRAVGNRCAANLAQMNLPMSIADALETISRKNIKPIEVDLIALARSCIDSTRYRLGVDRSEAPAVVDCSTFTAWLYGQRGIWLPRRTIQQRACGQPVTLAEVAAGDLVFASGCNNYYETDPAEGVGHVGMATGQGTVIHAAGPRVGVKEVPLEVFQSPATFRGARRYITVPQQTMTFYCPDEPIEISDDLRWLILRQLEKV